ncbi:MAG: J domain-containing protein [Planctomycetes bacterium]|nr:J domain-containing protein [Planctomycetota bacterium]
MPQDYYDVLGVKREASDDEIKRAYRKLARELHPDRNPGDKKAEARFKEVQEAYDVLSDKAKKSQYDRYGFAGPDGGFPGGGRAGGGPTFHWGGGSGGGFPGGFQVDPEQAEEILSQIFGGGMGGMGGFGERRTGGRRPRGREPAVPVSADVSIPFTTAALGGKVSFHVNDKEIEVTIPAGVQEGKSLRVQGQGPGGGDLLLKLHIEPHPYFQREGNNIILEVPLSLSEAVLGAKVDVPTLAGAKLSVTIRPGTASGSRLRLKEQGIKGGDQFIAIKVVVPAPKDERSREIVEEFARLNPQNPRSGPPWE